MGQEFRNGTMEMICFCSMMPGASAGKSQIAEDDLNDWTWNHLEASSLNVWKLGWNSSKTEFGWDGQAEHYMYPVSVA